MTDEPTDTRPGLVLVWAEMPFVPLDRAPRSPALAIGRWQDAARSLPPLALPTARFPPLPILSLDPTDRLERAFREAGAPLSVLRTRRDLPARDRPSLLQLGGDLSSRAGLLLSWEDVRAAGEDADKAYLLGEARRVAQGGAVWVWAPAPDEAFGRLWRTLLAPTLRGAARALAFGPAAFPWPEPLQHEARTLQEALDSLAVGAEALPSPEARLSRKADLEEAIRESYGLVREYEAILRTSDRPEEKKRARRIVDEQWAHIEGYLGEYRRLTGGGLAAGLDEIAARFRSE